MASLTSTSIVLGNNPYVMVWLKAQWKIILRISELSALLYFTDDNPDHMAFKPYVAEFLNNERRRHLRNSFF